MSKDTVNNPDPYELTDDELDAVAGGTFDRPGAGDITPQAVDPTKKKFSSDPSMARDFGITIPR